MGGTSMDAASCDIDHHDHLLFDDAATLPLLSATPSQPNNTPGVPRVHVIVRIVGVVGVLGDVCVLCTSTHVSLPPGISPQTYPHSPHDRPSFDLLSVQHDVPLPHNSYAALQAYLTTLRPTNPRNTPQHIIPQDTPTQQTPPTASLQHQVLFTNHLYQQHCHHFITNQQSTNHTAVAMVALTAIDQHTLSTHLLPWLQYHITTIGICGKIYLLYDGTDVKTFSLLQQLSPLVYTQALQRPLASQTLFDHYQGYVETIQQHLPRPLRGNTLLMVKQQYAMACGLTWAANDKQQWLVHLDPDELLSLEGPQGAVGIVKVLEGVPPHVPSVRFLNAEAQAEEGVVPPFAEEGLDGIGGGSWGDAFRKVRVMVMVFLMLFLRCS